MADGDEIDGGELTARERVEIRKLLKKQERTQWLFSTLKIWAIWIAAMCAGIYGFLSILRDSIKTLGGGDGGAP